MWFAALRKIYFYGNRGCRILINIFHGQLIYVGDVCVEYNCIELKWNNDVGKMFFVYLEFSTKGSIVLNETFERSPNETLSYCTNQGNQERLMR